MSLSAITSCIKHCLCAVEMRVRKRAAHLGADLGVEESTEIGPHVAHAGVPKQVPLRAAAAAAVDVGLDACVAPAHQAVRHVPEELRAQHAARKALVPDVALWKGGRQHHCVKRCGGKVL
jgi:hypothetical protein